MSETEERWVPVFGFEGIYEVSDRGNVRRIGGRILKPSKNHNGYLCLNLHSRGFNKGAPVHRIVLESFVSLRPDGMQARHLNGNRTDNRIENLAWGTHAENVEDRRRHGTDRHGEDNHFSKLTKAAVIEIRSSPESTRKLAMRFNVAQTTIQEVRKGITWKSVKAA